MLMGLVEERSAFILSGGITWPHDQKTSLLCPVWCLKVSRKWRYKAFVLSHNIASPHDQRDMWLGEWDFLNTNYQFSTLDAYRSCRRSGEISLSCHMTSLNLTIKETCVLPVGALHSKLPTYHVWWLEILLKWRYNVFILSRDIKWSRYQKNIQLWRCSTVSKRSPLCQIWCLKVLWKWRYRNFVLPCEITQPHIKVWV